MVKGKGYKLIKCEVMDKKYVRMVVKDGKESELVKKLKESQAKLQEDTVEGKEVPISMLTSKDTTPLIWQTLSKGS